MKLTSMNTDAHLEETRERQRELLELARHLDRFGRGAERFLIQQFEQLELAVEELNREKAAWRRQLRRESGVLARQRADLERLRHEVTSKTSQRQDNSSQGSVVHNREAETLARKSGLEPLTLLLQPGRASLMQVGLLLFEISKLNRDMGGRGVRFEVVEVRSPRKRLFGKSETSGEGRILQLRATSVLPLQARGTHVELDVDVSDRVEDWIAYKARLLGSQLVRRELDAIFQRGRTADQDSDVRDVVREACRRADDAVFQEQDHSGYSSTSVFGICAVNAAKEQLERLESCAERLKEDCGLQLHVGITTD